MNTEHLHICAAVLSDVELGLVLIQIMMLKNIAIAYHKMKQDQMRKDNVYNKL